MSKSTRTPKVSIVGAGAMGLTLGYHLQLAGAEVAFLVRPPRAGDLARPQVLYSYDDGGLKRFADYAVTTSPAEAAASAPDYVIVTLDGAATTSAEGSGLLATLGAALAGGGGVMIGGGVGIGLREHYLRATRLPANRVLMGVLGSFAYQVARTTPPLHPPTDPAILAQADIAYRHHGKSGFILENRIPAAAKRFAALYDRNGAGVCTVMEPHLYDISTNAPFPIFAGSELLGWPIASEVPKHPDVWRLVAGAVREIAGLDRHGWRGKLAGLALGDGVVSAIWNSIDKGSLPLDFNAFNDFHHGAKVAAQDSAILKACVMAGEAEGKPMAALKELLRRLEDMRAAKQDP